MKWWPYCTVCCRTGSADQTYQNVTFGIPRHRGCEGGEPCRVAFDHLLDALEHDFKNHDLLVQASASHYHLAAMQAFLDGNGRTARALFRNTMHDLFNRLKSERKRVIQRRQIATLQVLLEVDQLDLSELFHRVEGSYAGVANPARAFNRDILGLVILEAVESKRVGEKKWLVRVRLDPCAS
jgi:hypothetical protein